MSPAHLPSGVFLGSLALSVSAGGFRVDLRTATLPPEAVAEHAHDDAHFILTLDDGYRSLARDPDARSGQGAALPAGSLIYNPPGVRHRDCFDRAGGRFLAVSAPPLPAGPLDDAPVQLKAAGAGAAARRLVGACIRAGDPLEAESQALALAGCVAGETDQSWRAPDWLRRADEAIGDLACRPGLEVRTIAALVGVHPVHLARRYRRHFGVSPGTAIHRRRADRAAVLLAAGPAPAEAALLAGYADQSHLTREFSRVFGVTPARYRAALA